MLDNIKINKLDKYEKVFLYKELTKDYINVEALFSDETENFVSSPEPGFNEKITIKLRCAKDNIDKAYFCHNNNQFEMKVGYSDEFFDFYEYTTEPIKSELRYYFTVVKDDIKYIYNKKDLNYDLDEIYNFVIIPGFKSPDWAKGAVMYQIYVDRFFNGDPTNDPKSFEYLYLGKVSKKIDDWNAPLENTDICNFYGGDLQGVIDKMEYLKDLGVEVIYFNPIFVSPSNHKYDTQDYDYVDPHYGKIVDDGGEVLSVDNLHNRQASMYLKRTTDKKNLEASNELFIKLVEIAHKNGIRVILDGVFNHCGAYNKWMDKEGFYYRSNYPVGAYRDQNSIYHDYFKWYDTNWPNNDCYDSWWGFDNHPKLNFENSKDLYNYILEVGAKWVSPPYNADGWRLDVAADLGHSEEFNHKFWHDFRNSVKTANPDAIILAEHYGEPAAWLRGDQWDTVMNYDAFMEPLTWFLTGMEKHSEKFKEDKLNNAMDFENTMRYFMSKFSYQSLYTAMNELSNHDHSRFFTRTNMTVGRLHTKGAGAADINTNLGIMMEAIVVQMTWPGAPTIYYGDEAGLTGWSDPDNRRPYPWGKENKTILELYKRTILVHKKSKALRKGSIKFIYSNYGILSYARWLDDETVIVILNNNKEDKFLTIPVWKVNVEKDSVLYQTVGTDQANFFTNLEEFLVKDGQLNINMPPFSSITLSNKIFN